jgi:hypothetical protein
MSIHYMSLRCEGPRPTFGETLLNVFLKGAGLILDHPISQLLVWQSYCIFDEKTVGGGLTSRMTGSAVLHIVHRAENKILS